VKKERRTRSKKKAPIASRKRRKAFKRKVTASKPRKKEAEQKASAAEQSPRRSRRLSKKKRVNMSEMDDQMIAIDSSDLAEAVADSLAYADVDSEP
jgi:hypothetical protein